MLIGISYFFELLIDYRKNSIKKNEILKKRMDSSAVLAEESPKWAICHLGGAMTDLGAAS